MALLLALLISLRTRCPDHRSSQESESYLNLRESLLPRIFCPDGFLQHYPHLPTLTAKPYSQAYNDEELFTASCRPILGHDDFIFGLF
jgi:hypothetical protein